MANGRVEGKRSSLLETAELAYYLTSQDWKDLNFPTSRRNSANRKNRIRAGNYIYNNNNKNKYDNHYNNSTNDVSSDGPDCRKQYNPRNNLERYTENILALLHIRIIAILYKRSETPGLPNFRDLSTTTISRTIMAAEARRCTSHDPLIKRTKPLTWPEKLSEDVSQQLRKYVFKTLSMYRNVFYHNCEHAHHVFSNANKLLDSVLCEWHWVSLSVQRPQRKGVEWMEKNVRQLSKGVRSQDIFNEKVVLAKGEPRPKRERPTYGIKSDPNLHFGFLFSALVHDVDHQGVSNRQLVNESDEVAIMYNDQSVQEQRSLAIAFTLLMKEEYKQLRNICFKDRKEFLSFRGTVINLVLCTDISNPERIQILKSKWAAAEFSNHPLHDSKYKRELFGAKRNPVTMNVGRQSLGSISPKDSFESNQYSERTEYKEDFSGKQRPPTRRVSTVSAGTRISSPVIHEHSIPSSLTMQVNEIVSKLGALREDTKSTVLDDTDDDGSQYILGIRKALDRSGDVIQAYNDDNSLSSDPDLPNTLKANVILELMLNTADIGANMQEWDTMLKWATNLFDELKTSFIAGRGGDPAKEWHAQQIGFFESYVQPLASSITELDILDQDVEAQIKFHVLENHIRWKTEGMQYTGKMLHPWTQIPVENFAFSDIEQDDGNESESVSIRKIVRDLRCDPNDDKKSTLPAQIHITQDPNHSLSESQKYETVAVWNKLSELNSDRMFHVDMESISGLQYVLACYIMFMTIGSKESWGQIANLRSMPWHEHLFFLLGGFTMALSMQPMIVTKLEFVKTRVRAIYPVYLVAITFALMNLIVVCRPSTFRNTFHWEAQPDDLILESGDPAPLFCEGTPVFPSSYWPNLVSTIILSLTGLTVTPFWPLSWFLGYCLWYNNIYLQCLLIYPWTYNAIFVLRKKKQQILILLIAIILFSQVLVLVPGISIRNVDIDNRNGDTMNMWALHFILFGPFWMTYFILGICLAFAYDAIKPANGSNRRLWGWIADVCTLAVCGISALAIFQGPLGIPDHADVLVKTVWGSIAGRLVCPLTAIWVFALSTGQGYTARALRDEFLIKFLSPNAYSCFLFHQMVAQVYFAITRPGSFWNYWSYRGTFYWFAPQQVPVEWYEYFLLVGLITYFSHLVQNVALPLVWRGWINFVKYLLLPKTTKKKIESEDGAV